MKKYILVIVTLFSAVYINGQSTNKTINFLDIENGVNFSSFDFSNSDSTTAFINGKYSPQQHYAIKIGKDLTNELSIVIGGALDQHQIVGGKIDSLNTHYSYDLNYFSYGLELQYSKEVSTNLELIANAGVSMNHLLSGFQNIGSLTYDLSETQFKDISGSVNYGVSLLYHHSETMGLYIRYNTLLNGSTLEAEDSTETYFINSRCLSVGVRFSITK
jgi:hypothetical protein|tara:strand:+ start:92 stop:742 length:651 start_codon:yes stop_codon:yes gene_type:complete